MDAPHNVVFRSAMKDCVSLNPKVNVCVSLFKSRTDHGITVFRTWHVLELYAILQAAILSLACAFGLFARVTPMYLLLALFINYTPSEDHTGLETK